MLLIESLKSVCRTGPAFKNVWAGQKFFLQGSVAKNLKVQCVKMDQIHDIG